MKVIDLLNKIANGKEVPKKIHIKQFQSDFIFNGYTYLSDEKQPQNIYWCLHSDSLNYEVEILDEIEEKKIPEKLNISNFPKHNNSLKKTAIKLNEIIDYLKSKGDDINE